ncbi:MAG: vitamin K epoxide reductase family protein [Gammaproteobacteria bacterium]|nr:vitamin K epoxide reductase family protein [Gammaproteobacteria bacterium]
MHAKAPIVHAVLFFSPTCPHCHEVIDKHLPPLLAEYGADLKILGISTITAEGHKLFLSVMEHFSVPEDERGVPVLVIGQTLLSGSHEIPEQLPGLIEQGMASGGTPWPDLVGLPEILQAKGLMHPDADKMHETISLEMTLGEKFSRDPLGNSVALLVLVGMLISLGMIGYYRISATRRLTPWPEWTFPVLLPIGLAVASYLSFVEVAQVEAVCGPIGDCNAVQQSPYAFLFGVIPIAILGLLSYIAIGIAWALQQIGPQKWRRAAAVTIFLLTLIGTLFSVYLTFLEPFVIGATCIWCIVSAVTMTLMLWAAASNPGILVQPSQLKP